MTLETLLIVLAILAFVFVNVVRPWLRKHRAVNPPGNASSDAPQQTQTHVQTPRTTATTPSHVPIAVIAAPRETPSRTSMPSANGTPLAPPPRRRRSSFVSLADARRGIVLRTILGPCRAQRPFDSRSN